MSFLQKSRTFRRANKGRLSELLTAQSLTEESWWSIFGELAEMAHAESISDDDFNSRMIGFFQWARDNNVSKAIDVGIKVGFIEHGSRTNPPDNYEDLLLVVATAIENILQAQREYPKELKEGLGVDQVYVSLGLRDGIWTVADDFDQGSILRRIQLGKWTIGHSYSDSPSKPITTAQAVANAKLMFYDVDTPSPPSEEAFDLAIEKIEEAKRHKVV